MILLRAERLYRNVLQSKHLILSALFKIYLGIKYKAMMMSTAIPLLVVKDRGPDRIVLIELK